MGHLTAAWAKYHNNYKNRIMSIVIKYFFLSRCVKKTPLNYHNTALLYPFSAIILFLYGSSVLTRLELNIL